MGLTTLKGALFGTKKVLSPEQEISRFLDSGNLSGLTKYVAKNPRYIVNAIEPFKNAHFERPRREHDTEEDRNKFLQCAVFLMGQFHAHCPNEAWAAFTEKKKGYHEYPTAQFIASIRYDDTERGSVAKELSSEMLSLAESVHPWHLEEKLPPQEQFFYKWMRDQAQVGFNDPRPKIEAKELSRWMRKLGPIAPVGWENEFVYLALSHDFIRTEQDAKIMLNRPGVNLYATFDDKVKGTPLEGTTGNNILHLVALLRNYDQRFLFDALNDLHFRDSPNSAGLYGAQAIMDLPGEINTKYGVRPAFGMQLPLKIEGDAKDHPFEKLALSCELQGLNSAAYHLRLSMRAETGNREFRDYTNIAEFAMYNAMPDVLRSAMDLGDRVIPGYVLNSGFPTDFEKYDSTRSVLYAALEMWAMKPEKYTDTLAVILDTGIGDALYQKGVAKTLDTFSVHRPDIALDALPIHPQHPTLTQLEERNPELHARMLAARQTVLPMEETQPS